MKVAVGVTLAIVLVVAGVVGGSWAYRYYTAPVRGKVGAQEIRQAAPLRIAAYNHFFDACAAVQALEGALAAGQQQFLVTTDSGERTRINANIAGLRSYRAKAVAQYNADARKDYTIGQFRDADLPYQLDVKKEETLCGYE